MSKPELTQIGSKEDLIRIAEKYQEETDKNTVDREDVVQNTEEIINNDEVRVVETTDDVCPTFEGSKTHLENKLNCTINNEFDFMKRKLEDECNSGVNIQQIVYIPQEIAKDLESGVPGMADDNVRDNDERFTGNAAEVAFHELARYIMDNHSQIKIDSLRDTSENNIFVGDFLFNDYILELKSAKTSSAAQNVTHRNHGEDETGMMFCKNGIFPEMYAHSVVSDNREFGAGVIVGFLGMTPTLPEHNGIYGVEPRVLKNQWSYFMVSDIGNLEWYDITGKGWCLIEPKIEEIDI